MKNKTYLIIYFMIFVLGACDRKNGFTNRNNSTSKTDTNSSPEKLKLQISQVTGSTDGSFTLSVEGRNFQLMKEAYLIDNQHRKYELNQLNSDGNLGIKFFEVKKPQLLTQLKDKVINLVISTAYGEEVPAPNSGFVLQGSSAFIHPDGSKVCVGDVNHCTSPLKGKDGKNGKNGTNGINGKTGTNGANGSSPIVKAVQNKVCVFGNGENRPATSCTNALTGSTTVSSTIPLIVFNDNRICLDKNNSGSALDPGECSAPISVSTSYPIITFDHTNNEEKVCFAPPGNSNQKTCSINLRGSDGASGTGGGGINDTSNWKSVGLTHCNSTAGPLLGGGTELFDANSCVKFYKDKNSLEVKKFGMNKCFLQLKTWSISGYVFDEKNYPASSGVSIALAGIQTSNYRNQISFVASFPVRSNTTYSKKSICISQAITGRGMGCSESIEVDDLQHPIVIVESVQAKLTYDTELKKLILHSIKQNDSFGDPKLFHTLEIGSQSQLKVWCPE